MMRRSGFEAETDRMTQAVESGNREALAGLITDQVLDCLVLGWPGGQMSGATRRVSRGGVDLSDSGAPGGWRRGGNHGGASSDHRVCAIGPSPYAQPPVPCASTFPLARGTRLAADITG